MEFPGRGEGFGPIKFEDLQMRTYIEKVKRYIVSWMQKKTGFQFLWNVGPVYMMLSKGPTFLECFFVD